MTPENGSRPPGNGADQDRTVADGARPAPASPPSARGTPFGRYLLLERVGAGGMGEVWAAYDPELDRRVAIKLVRRDLISPQARALLQREAQAMARLSHPNVVVVHDVGVVDGQTYVAMEFIDGPTLQHWLAAGERRPEEILAHFVAAGRGLAAAHRAGLVHRDFKPGNVMIGADGRVRVTDFGLARASASAPPDSGAPTLGRAIAVTAGPAGTPLYMAPEQHRSLPADARSDQFSYCASLYEALFGVHPFAAANLEDLRRRMEAGELTPPRRRPRLPAAVVKAIVRGLAADPAARHPDLESLLAVIARDPRARRRRAAGVVLGVASLVAIVFGVVQLRERRLHLCSGATEEWATVWDAKRHAAIAAAFTATGAPFAGDAVRQVGAALDDYGARWAAAYTAACEATRVRGEQSERILDREVACLQLRLRQADAVLGLLEKADVAGVAGAADAITGLRPVASCVDVASLAQEQELPSDPAARRTVGELQRRLAEADARRLVGDYEGAAVLARDVAGAAPATGYGPLEAEASQLAGELEIELGRADAAEAALRSALAAGERAGSDRAAAAAAKELIWLEAVERNRFDEAERWWQFGEAKLRRLGDNPEVEAGLLVSRAGALNAAGRYAEAAALERRNLELAIKLDGAESLSTATTRNQLAQTLDSLGDYTGAAVQLREAVAVKERVLGPRHPALANSLTNLGSVLAKLGRIEEAVGAQQRAVAILEAAFGHDSPMLSVALNNLAFCLEKAGRLDDALAAHDRNLAIVRADLGKDDPQVAYTLLNRASLLRAAKRPREALADAREAERILAAALGTDHPLYAYAANAVGFMLILDGRPAQGVPFLERALAIRVAGATEPLVLAATRLNLGRALWEAGLDRERSRRLIREARAAFRAQGELGREDLANLESWAVSHGVDLDH